MNEEIQLMAAEELAAMLEQISANPAGTLEMFADLANKPYDAEVGIPDLIQKVCKLKRLEKGAEYKYYPISPTVKTVHTVVNGSVVQTNVSVTSKSTLTLNTYNTPEEYIYLEELLGADYEPIADKTKDAMEVCNRKEVKDVIDVMIASAVGQSQTFHNDSGVTALNIVKLEEMVRAVSVYGSNFALITGSTVGADITFLNYNADKNQPVSLEAVRIKEWINISAFQYTHSTTQTVMAADKAIIVALSDAENERPVHFVRRKVRDIQGGTGEKERIVVNLGPRMQVGADPKMALSIIVAEQYGVVQPNPYATAVYKRAQSYS